MHKNKNIIVTGGAGYIGSHTCKTLYKAGFNPICADDLSSGHKDFVKWGMLEQGDIKDESWLGSVFSKHKPISIIHCAGSICVEDSIKNPKLYFSNNVDGTISVINAMKKKNLNNLIYSSTASIYGSNHKKPIDELAPPNPENPYAESKLKAEKIIQNSNINSVILRYFNAAGADTANEIGELHKPETHLIPLAINAALNNKKFIINGNDFPTKDGTAVRDFIHVTDIANAHLKAISFVQNNKGCNIFNIGSSKGLSVLEILKTIEQINNQKIDIEIKERRKGDADILIADTSKAADTLNFKPQFSDIDNIIKTALYWHKR